ncbi:MAG: putative sulfate exporter family transporter [Acidobacteriota bacterium]
MKRLVPGLLLASAIALVAFGLHAMLPTAVGRAVGAVVLAVLLGLIVGQAVPTGEALAPGLRFAFQTLLRLAIVLLGVRLSFAQVAAIGGRAVLLILVLMALALGVAHGLGRWSRISPRLASLIGVGTAVCGNSAIAAVAPVIAARDEEVSFAVATNTLFGTLAVFLYPMLAVLLGLDAVAYGTWAGVAVNDTSQVVAAGFAHSPEAGEVATAVKLTRNALMGFVILMMGWLYRTGGAGIPLGRRLRQSVPPFVLGFLAMAALRTVGAFDLLSAATGIDWVAVLSTASRWLILIALAAVGASTRLANLRRAGWRPLAVGLAAAVATSLVALLWIQSF